MVSIVVQLSAISVQLVCAYLVLRHLRRNQMRTAFMVAATLLLGLLLPQIAIVLKRLGVSGSSSADLPEAIAWLANSLLALGAIYALAVWRRQAGHEGTAAPASLQETRNRESLQQMADDAPFAVFVADQNGRLTLVNRKWEELIGRPRNDLQQQRLADLVHPGDRASFSHRWDDAFRSKQVFTMECRFQRPDRHIVWGECNGTPEIGAHGEVVGYRGTVTDITTRMRTENALRHERGLFIAGPTVVFRWLAQEGWPVAYVSPNVRSQFGYRPDDLTSGRVPYATLVHPDDLERVAEEVRQFTAARVVCAEQEYRLANANGDYRWVNDFTILERDEHGEISSYLGYLLDVTERREAEETLRHTLRSYADVLTAIPTGLCIFQYSSPDVLTLIDSNRAAEELAGIYLEESRGRRFEEIWRAAKELGMLDAVLQVVGTGETYYEESFAYTDDRVEGAFRFRAFRMPNDRLGFAFDNVTELKRAERLLLESERRFRLLFNDAPIAYQSLDENCVLLQVNDAWLSVLGYESGEVLGKPFANFVAPSSASHFVMEQEQLRRCGRVDGIELELVHKTGRTILISLSGKIGYSENGSVKQTHCVFRDITALRESEIALRESEERYRQMFEGNLAVKLLIDPNDGSIVDANQAATQFYGYSHDQLTSMKISQINMLPSEEVAQRMEAVRSAKAQVFQFKHRRADGSVADVEVHSNSVTVGGRTLLYSIIHDISDRCRAEEQKAILEEQLRRAQKLETIGTLAAGIAHDFNNLLVPVIGYGEMIQSDHPDDSATAKHIGEVLKASYRARDLVTQILSFSRQQGGERKIVQLQTLVREVLTRIRNAAPPELRIDEQLDASTPPILADPVQIAQVLEHLCRNTVEAMPHGGTLTVILGSTPPRDRRWPTIHRHLGPDRAVYLTLEDTGLGMDPATLERIFDPFFTTKDVGQGSGLGLSVAHGVIAQHGGHIAGQSEPGVGTTMCLTLPAAHLAPDIWSDSMTDIKGARGRLLATEEDMQTAEPTH